jgi:hypothetical protein
MVLRQLLVLALAVLTLHASTEATSIAPPCPRSLETVLESAPCSPHMGRLLTTASTTIEFTEVQDVCLDSLRELVAASAAIPCVTNLDLSPAIGHSRTRRLDGGYKGKLTCTFDTVAPLNLSNPMQSIAINCTEIPGAYDYTWVWIAAGLFGGPIALWVLYILISRGAKKIKNWSDERAQLALDRTEDTPRGFFSRFGSKV